MTHVAVVTVVTVEAVASLVARAATGSAVDKLHEGTCGNERSDANGERVEDVDDELNDIAIGVDELNHRTPLSVVVNPTTLAQQELRNGLLRPVSRNVHNLFVIANGNLPIGIQITNRHLTGMCEVEVRHLTVNQDR